MKAAFVAVVGRPSAGKSTLVNCLCGAKVSIVGNVPQTTRNAIRGIVHHERGQLVFIDTPGRHSSEKKINKKLMEVSQRALNESDLVLYVLDTTRAPGEEEIELAKLLVPYAEKTVAVLNKTDAPSSDCRRIVDFLSGVLPEAAGKRCLSISAKNNEGMGPLLSMLFDMAPDSEPFYDKEYYTDQAIDFRIAEIIREQAIKRLYEELPHALYVQVADTEFRDTVNRDSLNPVLPEKEQSALSQDQLPSERPRLWVRAFIVVERESQKGMVVGSGGTMIKAIRQASQKELNKIFDWKIELDLRVKTCKDWLANDNTLRKIIG